MTNNKKKILSVYLGRLFHKNVLIFENPNIKDIIMTIPSDTEFGENIILDDKEEE